MLYYILKVRKERREFRKINGMQKRKITFQGAGTRNMKRLAERKGIQVWIENRGLFCFATVYFT